jgi:hypothetical protein
MTTAIPSDCESCTKTEKMEGQTCSWYGRYCGTGGCDMVSCPVKSCPLDDNEIVVDEEEPLEQGEVGGSATITGPDIDEAEDIALENATSTTTNITSNDTLACHVFGECELCLNMQCVWTAEACEKSCEIADAGCYMMGGGFGNKSGPEICAAAETTDEVTFEGLVEAERAGDHDMVIIGLQGSTSAAFTFNLDGVSAAVVVFLLILMV